MSLKDDLTAAKALIDTPEKWVKGLHGSTGWPHCAMGAVIEIVGQGLRTGDGYSDCWRALNEQVPSPFEGVRGYNDDPATTHADIMDLFDRAINAASIASLDAAIAECAKPLPRHA